MLVVKNKAIYFYMIVKFLFSSAITVNLSAITVNALIHF